VIDERCINEFSSPCPPYELHKKVKEQAPSSTLFLSSSHRIVLPQYTQALAFIDSVQWTIVNSQGFDVSLAVQNFCQKHAVAKMLRQQNPVILFNRSVFQRSVTHFRAACARWQTKPLQ
jgi:hypothetical protein